jgi:hypothetical protein
LKSAWGKIGGIWNSPFGTPWHGEFHADGKIPKPLPHSFS